MASKNLEKRNEILNCSYRLVSEGNYNMVSLSDIANGAGISKSLLQYYYPQKKDIIKNLLSDMLETSFQFMDRFDSKGDIFYKLSDYMLLFFTAVDADKKLDHFVMATIGENELLDIWIDIVFQWLRKLKEDSGHKLSSLKLRAALSFSMTGAMCLYQHREAFDIDVPYICEQHLSTLMRMLDFDDKKIGDVLRHTRESISEIDIQPFYEFCESNISWFLM